MQKYCTFEICVSVKLSHFLLLLKLPFYILQTQPTFYISFGLLYIWNLQSLLHIRYQYIDCISCYRSAHFFRLSVYLMCCILVWCVSDYLFLLQHINNYILLKSLMAELKYASQWQEMYYDNLEVLSLNPGRPWGA